MSVVRSCLRLAAVAAVRDRCWKDVRVFDSDNQNLELGIKEEPSPYVVVFTDDDVVTDIDGRDYYSGDRGIAVVIEFGLAAAVPASGDDPAHVAIPATDRAFELALDALDSMIMDALFAPRSAWGELFRDLAVSIPKVSGKRGGAADKGVRWAARQRIIEVLPIDDPAPGVAVLPRSPIANFVNALEADGDAVGLGSAIDFIRAAVSQPNDFSWRQAQALLGLTLPEVAGIGLTRPDGADLEAPLLVDAEVPGAEIVSDG